MRLAASALLAASLAAGGCAATGVAHAAGDERPAVSAPVRQFIANAPGTYALPVIQCAGNGWVLEGNRFPHRLSRYTHGAITLLSFVYSYCADPLGCSFAYSVFVDVRARVLADRSLRDRVRFVSLSFDPTNDTPRAMQRYGGEFARAQAPRWHFLTTSSMRFLRPILDAYGQDVEIERDAAGAPTRAITHLLKVFLIDAQGRVREIYGVAFLHADVVFNDIRTLAMEAADDAATQRTAARDPAQRADHGAGAVAQDTRRASDEPLPGTMPVRIGMQALGRPPLQPPDGVVLDRARIELGRALFFDRRLSSNGTMSCTMCHVPEQGFASNASRRSVGLFGRSLPRNAPSLLDVAWRPALFHDGREASLVRQAWQPLLHPDEMGNATENEVLARIRTLREYDGRFERAFNGHAASRRTVGEALAAFVASLVAAPSRFDRWRFGGEGEALSPLERRGFALFTGKARCSTCHLVGERFALFADGAYHATGAGAETTKRHVVELAPGVRTELGETDLASLRGESPGDDGRFAVTRDPLDRHAFRTPMLRGVARTAPYMHDGSIATLEAVVELYDRGGGAIATRSPLLRPLGLTSDEKRALVAFLRSLDPEQPSPVAAAAGG